MNKQLEYFFNANKLESDLDGILEDDVHYYNLLQDYLIVSANIFRYLPDINPKSYFKMAKDILLYNQLALLDQRYFFLLDDVRIIDKNQCLDELHKRSYIITTYHTGSYRLVIPFLLKKHVKFVIVTDEKFIQDQSNEIHELQTKLSEYLNNSNFNPLEIISAQDPVLLMKLKAKIEEGYSVVFYIDGNTGLFKYNIDESKLLKIPFLADYIYVRKGIAFLSYLTKTKIISILSERQKDLSNIINIKSIECNFSLSRNDFIQDITTELYCILESLLKKYPTQWEGWMYLNEFNQGKQTENIKAATLVKDLIGNELIFNEREFKLVKIPEGNYLVNYKIFKIIALTELIYNLLLYFKTGRKIKRNPIVFKNTKINHKIVKELFNLNYLIYV